MSRKICSCLLGAALLAGTATASHAQTLNLPNGFYVGVNAGVLVPESVSWQVAGTSDGLTLSGSGDINFETGPATGIVLGYRANEWLALEGNFEYAAMDMRTVTGEFTASGAATGSGSLNIGLDGHINSYTTLFNALFYPSARQGWNGLSFYIGGGVGFSAVDATLNRVRISNTTVVLNSSDSETDFAADGIVGVDYPVSPELSIGARYRLIYVNTGSVGSGGGFTASSGDFIGHVITANLTWNF